MSRHPSTRARAARALIAIAAIFTLPACTAEGEPIGGWGDRAAPGGGFILKVGPEFKRRDLETIYDRSQASFPAALQSFTCGDPVPELSYLMRIEALETKEDRLVTVSYSPSIREDGRDRCLYTGIIYLFERGIYELEAEKATAAREKGKTIRTANERIPPRPRCRCELRGSNEDWVDFPDMSADGSR
jgi:hypothetical protein